LVLPDNNKSETLARNILDLDPSILSVIIVSLQNGSTLAEHVKSSSGRSSGFTTQNNSGMAGRWAILAYNSMERLESSSSKESYLLMVNDVCTRLIFQARLPETVLIGLALEPKATAAEIYHQVKEILGEARVPA
jgi:hypothetical protein